MDQDRITEFINKSEIMSVVNSYFRALDEKNFDARHFASIFTPQAKVTRPIGASLIGPEEISASHQKASPVLKVRNTLSPVTILLSTALRRTSGPISSPCTCGKAVKPTRTSWTTFS